MNSSKVLEEKTRESESRRSGPPPKQVNAQDILNDLKAGVRTRDFLSKYGFEISEFQSILKRLIRFGSLTREEFNEWKRIKRKKTSQKSEDFEATQEFVVAEDFGDQEDVQDLHQDSDNRANGKAHPSPAGNSAGLLIPHSMETYIVPVPEKNSAWAMKLFSTDRDRMAGATFNAVIERVEYTLTVEELLFRGEVNLVNKVAAEKADPKKKREEAIDFIYKHGWAAFLESKAIAANFDNEDLGVKSKARLVLLKCPGKTYVAALHTPAPAVSFYVGPSLQFIKDRLAKSVAESDLDWGGRDQAHHDDFQNSGGPSNGNG